MSQCGGEGEFEGSAGAGGAQDPRAYEGGCSAPRGSVTGSYQCRDFTAGDLAAVERLFEERVRVGREAAGPHFFLGPEQDAIAETARLDELLHEANLVERNGQEKLREPRELFLTEGATPIEIVSSREVAVCKMTLIVGLVAGDGGAVIWPQLVGFAKAKELLMTGDLLSASEAQSLGLINYAVPTEELDAKVSELVAKLQGNPKWAVRWTKTVTNIPLRALAAQMMDASVGWESVSNYMDDRKEAVDAFREKRKPNLTGE